MLILAVISRGLPFIFYLVIICIISGICTTIIGIVGIIVFILSILSIIITLYLFRNESIYHTKVNCSNIIYPCNGTITNMSCKELFNVHGTAIYITSGLLDGYSYCAPIKGIVTDIIYLSGNSTYHHGAQIIIKGDFKTVHLIIYKSSVNRDYNTEIHLDISINSMVYSGQNIGTSLFFSKCILMIVDTEIPIIYNTYVTMGSLCLNNHIPLNNK